MVCKLFPKTWMGDQLRMSFDTVEERAAFDRVIKAMQKRVKENKLRESSIYNFRFGSTLEMEVARENQSAVEKIVGLGDLQIRGRDTVEMRPYADPAVTLAAILAIKSRHRSGSTSSSSN